jgi:hypothetical protein
VRLLLSPVLPGGGLEMPVGDKQMDHRSSLAPGSDNFILSQNVLTVVKVG